MCPRTHAITAEIARMRPEEPPPAAAVALLDHLWELVKEQWVIHFRTIIPAQVALEILHDQYMELIGSDDPLAPYRLLDGTETETNQADMLLWQVAQRARELGVHRILLECPPTLARERLRETIHGRQVLHQLDDYLLRFGGRSRWHELSLPREVEAPEITFESLRLFLERGVPPAIRVEEGRRLQAEALARAPQLAEALAAATVGFKLKENHVYHIDYPGLLAVKEVLLGFGRRLCAEGRLGAVEEVWMLTRAELRACLFDELGAPLTDLVARRRADMARGLAEGVRPYLGQPPADAERHAVNEKFYGRQAQESVGRMLKGTGVSARIVRGPEDWRRVQAGDVLIATTTTPAWTPLFPSLAAVVTETGGILCHAAIVAREYGLPAVVGVENATQRIPDGTTVAVNGSTGEVEILSPES